MTAISQTMKQRLKYDAPSRRHDHLYDPIFTVSAERDHERCLFKSHAIADKMKRYPIFRNMYSDLKHFPNHQMRLEVIDPVPTFISRQWRGNSDSLTPINDPEVSGKNRWKYFYRPLLPFMQHVPTDVILAPKQQDQLFIPGMAVQRKSLTNFKTKNVLVQTDYRDADVQTDPYTPDYVFHPGSQPEVLTLATLSWGRGLPAGVAEIEMIERARAKREWEKNLPPISDLSQFEKRRKMLEAMELKEWALREEMIEKLQLEQLELLKKLLSEREEKQASITNKRLDKIWKFKQKQKEKNVSKIRLRHKKDLRKFNLSKKRVEGKLERRDIIDDYINKGSSVFAPLTRDGVFPDRKQDEYVVKSSYLSTYDGLLDLEQTLPNHVTNPTIKVPVPPEKMIGPYIKRKYKQEFELKDIYDKIQARKIPKGKDKKPLRYLVKIEKPKPRPPTPTRTGPPSKTEEKELAVIYLQQLLRGEAVHNRMVEGKERHYELIKELQSTHTLQEEDQKLVEQKRQITLALQRQRETYEHKENIVNEALSRIEGSTIGNMFNFLSKELIHLQEEQKIHAFAMLAERQRRIREAEESGLRQEEERRRREDDEIFKQVVKVHQNTVDVYLEDVILRSMEYTTEIEARAYIQELATTINDITYEMEEKRTQLETEEIVGDLVHNFLLPDVEKEIMREKVKQCQSKYLMAAHKEVHQSVEEILEEIGAEFTELEESENESSS